ncbi:hypothetical protein MGYG_07993 [Nannizzia gypsea CBS 118893]|uniref:Uncharacterized protein n=1 Tax=Arthroderma gypseum (strain ATCC MYA-4604 / CBS 118893) TaxID=535722 RepID=E4V4R6_ARTGP|nr:hypothetical protein MGYG_07993 [Nannizzia gypsea CBS 118893]EFR04990.1 hypothetical protein MGYG_07993 [Nannizzia gypsea CBS 118893]
MAMGRGYQSKDDFWEIITSPGGRDIEHQSGLQCNVTHDFGNTPLHAASCTKEATEKPIRRLNSNPYPPLRRKTTQVDLSRLVVDILARKPKPSCRGSEEAILILLKYGAVVNMKNRQGVTALHLASESRDLSRLEALLDNVADINATDNVGWTALRCAISIGSVPTVKLLLRQKPDLR